MENKNPDVVKLLLNARTIKVAKKIPRNTLRNPTTGNVTLKGRRVLPKIGLVSSEGWNTVKFFNNARTTDVSRCLKAGADPNARSAYNIRGRGLLHSARTPMHMATAWSKIPAVVEALLKAGADVNARDRNGKTPLHRAARLRRTQEVVATFVRAGADPNAKDEKGLVPLHYAAVESTPAVVKALLDAEADPNARDERGSTPLHGLLIY